MRVFLFLLISAFLITSCKENYDAPCRNIQRDTLEMALNISGSFPYDGSDTVVFESDAGDSARCFTYGILQLYVNYGKAGGNPDCPADTAAHEVRRISLYDGLDKFRSEITTAILQDGSYHMTVIADGSTFDIDPMQIGSGGSLNYRDSMQLDGRSFYQVQSVVNGSGDSLYISRTRGILRLRNTQQGWTLR